LSPDGYRDVNCQHFPSGMYMLEVVSGEIIYRIKFLKN